MASREDLTDRVRQSLEMSRSVGRNGKVNISAASRLLGVPRETVRDWSKQIAAEGVIRTKPARVGAVETRMNQGAKSEKASAEYQKIVKAVYEKVGRNLKAAAAKLGLRVQDTAKIIKSEKPLKNAAKSIEKAQKAQDAKQAPVLIKETKRGGYTLRTYDAGKNPDLDALEEGDKKRFQVVFVGKMGGKRRTVTSSYFASAHEAMQQVESIIGHYDDLKVESIEILEFDAGET